MYVTDVATAAAQLVSLLQSMNPFDATCNAASIALNPDAYARHALAAALVTRFPLVGDDFILDVLTKDPDIGVRAAARRAATSRRLRWVVTEATLSSLYP